MSRSIALLALLAASPLPLPAQIAPSGATLVYHLERPGGPVPIYTFTLREDGSGTYTATHPAAGDATAGASTGPNIEFTAAYTLSPTTTARLFLDIRGTDHFRSRCESKAKNVANTGAKTIEYTGPDGHASCTFNYTENKAVAATSDTFAGIETTLEFGRELDHLHRYDRLGLDSEMTKFATAIKEKTALEAPAIAPILESIAQDNQVIERVRLQAGKLLQMR